MEKGCPTGEMYWRKRLGGGGGVEEVFEAVEAGGPFLAAGGEPGFEGGEAGGGETDGADAADFFGFDKAAVGEVIQVLGDGGEGDL